MTPLDLAYAERVRASFAQQGAMALIGAQLLAVEPGQVAITLPFRADLCQQHGFLHAGIVTAIVDSACGYAALTLMPPGAGVLTVEFKINLLNPAAGDRFVARGQVVKSGRTLMVATGEVTAERNGAEPKPVALMQATIMVIRDRPGVAD